MIRVILAALALGACTTIQGSAVVCPPVKPYSPALQTQLALEMEGMAATNAYPVTRMMIRDYVALRDMARACARQ